MRGDVLTDEVLCKGHEGDKVHLIGCVLRAVFKLSMVLFLSSSSSFSRARSVVLCRKKMKHHEESEACQFTANTKEICELKSNVICCS